VEGLKTQVPSVLNLDLPVADWAKEEGIADEEIRERLRKAADEAYAKRVEANSEEVMTYVEKQVLLQTSTTSGASIWSRSTICDR
jgi:preprotein translocase subunit SecA